MFILQIAKYSTVRGVIYSYGKIIMFFVCNFPIVRTTVTVRFPFYVKHSNTNIFFLYLWIAPFLCISFSLEVTCSKLFIEESRNVRQRRSALHIFFFLGIFVRNNEVVLSVC